MDLDKALDLSPITAWVYAVLSSGSVTPRVMAAAAGVSTRTIRRSVEQLRELGVEVQRNGQKSAVNPDIKPDMDKQRKLDKPAIINEVERRKTGHDIDGIPAIIPDDMVLHIPVRPGLEELLADPDQRLETPLEHELPPFCRGIPQGRVSPSPSPKKEKFPPHTPPSKEKITPPPPPYNPPSPENHSSRGSP